jgi:hypothetical protein
LAEESYYSRMVESLSSKGPAFSDSERVLCGALLAGSTSERGLLPCRAVDFTVPLHRAVFVACCVVPPGTENTRLAKIVCALEADGVLGVTADHLLELREAAYGERLEPHIRCVADAGSARRMAQYLEHLAQDLRLGTTTAAQATERLEKKLRGDEKPSVSQARSLIPLRSLKK